MATDLNGEYSNAVQEMDSAAEPELLVRGRLWHAFRGSKLWYVLRRIEFLRSGLYLAIELNRTFREDRDCSREAIDRDFRMEVDPFHYCTSELERKRLSMQAEVLVMVGGGRPFKNALEIGPAEGMFTEVLAARSESLLVLDVSPTALERTRRRCNWGDRVRFAEWDLRRPGPIPGTFDLIVATGVLEYFKSPRTFGVVRDKLVRGLAPGGYLFVESTRANEVVENAWWGRLLIRGRWINAFVSKHRELEVITHIVTDSYVITLFAKQARSETGSTCAPEHLGRSA